jgi:hypothetical protein
MGIADSFRQLAERAKAKMTPAEDATMDDDTMRDEKYDNAARDRFGLHGDRGRDMNERTDDIMGGWEDDRDRDRDRGRDRDISDR